MADFSFPPEQTKWQRLRVRLSAWVISTYIHVVNSITHKRLPGESNSLWIVRELDILIKNNSVKTLLERSRKEDMPAELRQDLIKFDK